MVLLFQELFRHQAHADSALLTAIQQHAIASKGEELRGFSMLEQSGCPGLSLSTGQCCCFCSRCLGLDGAVGPGLFSVAVLSFAI